MPYFTTFHKWCRPQSIIVLALCTQLIMAAGTVYAKDRLLEGELLYSGESINSVNGVYKLEVQQSGNLELQKYGYTIWESKTNIDKKAVLSMQEDGNLVLYSLPDWKPIWVADGTWGPNRENTLVLKNDSELSVYSANGTRRWLAKTKNISLPCIESISGPESINLGLENAFSIKVNNEYCSPGKLIMLGLESEEINEESELIYVSSIPVENLEADSQLIKRSVEIPTTLAEGKYTLVANLVEAESGDEDIADIIDDEDFYKNFKISESKSEVILPNLPSLEVSSFDVAGDKGYVLSQSSDEEIRINIELKNRNIYIYSPISTVFTLNIPGVSTSFPLSVKVDDSRSQNSWDIYMQCKSCPVIDVDEARGATLSLLLDENTKNALKNAKYGSVVELVVTSDANNRVREWQDDKEDNTKKLSLLLID